MIDWKGWDAMKWLNQSINMHHLGVECRVLEAKKSKVVATHDSKVGVWLWLWRMNSNLNLAKPFDILLVREWKGWDAVNCMDQSKLTQSWCQKWRSAKPTFTPPAPQKHIVMTILEPTYQSQPSQTIHHTYDDRWEGWRCYEMAESV